MLIFLLVMLPTFKPDELINLMRDSFTPEQYLLLWSFYLCYYICCLISLVGIFVLIISDASN